MRFAGVYRMSEDDVVEFRVDGYMKSIITL